MNDTSSENPRKACPEDLAILGGRPLFEEPRHVGRPNSCDRDHLFGVIGEILDRNWLTNDGPVVREFESDLARMLGVRHCIAVCNATVGLEILIRAGGLCGEVVLPSYTFIATAHALSWVGVRPVFADIDPRTHNVDPADVDRRITGTTTGILATHLWGRPAPVSDLEEIARRHGLALFFDAAHAFGCSVGGRMIGGFGDAEVFSFHATKVLNSFEGGAITTDRDDLASRIRMMRNFGFSGYDRVVEWGTNGKMHEVSAAMGLTNLRQLDHFIERNRENYLAYANGLRGLDRVRLLEFDSREKCNYQYVVVEVEGGATLGRDELIQVLTAENVLARKYFWPGCHRMKPYAAECEGGPDLLGNTDRVAGRVMVLPTGTGMSTADIWGLCSAIRVALSVPNKIRVACQG